jgi:hypothetical protein
MIGFEAASISALILSTTCDWKVGLLGGRTVSSGTCRLNDGVFKNATSVGIPIYLNVELAIFFV